MSDTSLALSIIVFKILLIIFVSFLLIKFFSFYNRLGVKSFILFPKVPDHLKTNFGEEAYNPQGIVPRAIHMIKAQFPDVIVCTDVALDPYSSMVREILLVSVYFYIFHDENCLLCMVGA